MTPSFPLRPNKNISHRTSGNMKMAIPIMARAGGLKKDSGSYRRFSGAEIDIQIGENDNLQATFRAKELVGLLAASGKEVKEEVERYDQKVEEMQKAALAGEYAALAAAWREPLEDVKTRASAFWGAKKKELGGIKGLEVLGSG